MLRSSSRSKRRYTAATLQKRAAAPPLHIYTLYIHALSLFLSSSRIRALFSHSTFGQLALLKKKERRGQPPEHALAVAIAREIGIVKLGLEKELSARWSLGAGARSTSHASEQVATCSRSRTLGSLDTGRVPLAALGMRVYTPTYVFFFLFRSTAE